MKKNIVTKAKRKVTNKYNDAVQLLRVSKNKWDLAVKMNGFFVTKRLKGEMDSVRLTKIIKTAKALSTVLSA